MNVDDMILKYLDECEHDPNFDNDFDDNASETSDHVEEEIVYEDSDDRDADPDFNPEDPENLHSGRQFPFHQRAFVESDDEFATETCEPAIEDKSRKVKKGSKRKNEESEAGTSKKGNERKKKKTKTMDTIFTRSEINPHILDFTQNILKGQGKKTTQTWNTKPILPSNRPIRHAARDIVHVRRGSKGTALNIVNPKELFSMYFTGEMKKKSRVY